MAPNWRWARPEEWDRIAGASPCATPFHLRSWCEAFAGYAPRYAPRALLVDLPSGVGALLPLFVRKGVLRRGPFTRAVSSRPGVYGGPITPQGPLGERGWSEFAAALGDAPLGVWECFGNVLDPQAPGANSSLRRTHLVDLEALPEDALASYDSNCRRNVRKAEREGVSVQRESGAAVRAEYHAMYVASQVRWGEDPARGYREELFERLEAAPCAELWTARTREGQLAAGGWFVASAKHVVYWHGAMHEELAPLRPANALHHALVVESRRRGARFYDFNPSQSLEGVEQFKRSFGAREVAFPTYSWRSPSAARWERWLGRAKSSS
jgi:hypothetical protein